MKPSELADVESVLRSQLGKFAKLRLHEREIKTPMNFVLDIAERQLNSKFSIFWVENAIPEMFSLRGFSEPIAIFNTRLVELWGDVRFIFESTQFERPLKVALIERLCLQLMAEHSLWKQNDPEFAAVAILRASTIQPKLTIIPNTIQSMEYEPITSVYMSCWFYGLVHELGHFQKVTANQNLEDYVRATIKHTIEDFPHLSDQAKLDVITRSLSNERGFILAMDSVLDEGVADVFATSVMLESTSSIMREIGDEAYEFDLPSFMTEMFISLNVIVAISRCERICKLASMRSPSTTLVIETLLHPVLIAVRSMLVRDYLEIASLHYLYGEKWINENPDIVSSAIDSIIEGLKPDIDAFEKGMDRAIEFMARRVNKPDFYELLDTWSKDEKDSTMVSEFLNVAHMRNLNSMYFETIRAKLNNPSAPLDIKVDGKLYLCPFIFGPDEFNRPFDLPTRHGNIIFVFDSQNPLCQKFCEVSSVDLREGFQVKPILMIADSVGQLEQSIIRRLEVGTAFKVVVEGTDFFDSCINELSDGTIWASE